LKRGVIYFSFLFTLFEKRFETLRIADQAKKVLMTLFYRFKIAKMH
jgi:hypothetical protein